MTMSIDPLGESALELTIDGKLQKADYEKFIPLAEERIRQNGHVNLLVRIRKLGMITPKALWQDLRFDKQHYHDIPRLAVVAKSNSKKWLVTLAKPFTAAQVEFYLESDLDKAREWVAGS